MKTLKITIVVKPNQASLPVTDEIAAIIGEKMTEQMKAKFEPQFTLVSCTAGVHEEKTPDELAADFIASAPTDEPTVEKEIELSKEELDATPPPATQPEGGIGEQSNL